MDGEMSTRAKEAANGHRVSRVSLSAQSSREKQTEIELGEGISLTESELRNVLEKQLLYVSGGLDEDKYPILTFPEEGLKYLETSSGFRELRTTLLYFKSLQCFADLSAGTTLLLDARNSRTHGAVKQLLDKIASKEIPLKVQVVYVYMKAGLFGRYNKLAGPVTATKLQVKYFIDQKSLLDQLDGSNVTVDLGGELSYDHKTWISNRLEYERVVRETLEEYPEFTQALQRRDLASGMSVEDAEGWMKEDCDLKRTLSGRLMEASVSVDNFLENLKSQQPGGAVEMAHDTKELVKLMLSLKLMSKEIGEKQKELSNLWPSHQAKMEHMIHMCQFHDRAEKLRTLLKEYLSVESAPLGDTLETALEHGERYEEYVSDCKGKLDEQMKRIDEDSQTLVKPTLSSEGEGEVHTPTHQAVDIVKTLADELKASYKELTELWQEKRDTCLVCVKFHMMTRQVQQWNQEVLEFLATLYLEEMSEEEAKANLTKMEDLHDEVQESQLKTVNELANSLPSERNFKKQASNAEEKYEQTINLLDVRKSHILKRMASLQQAREQESAAAAAAAVAAEEEKVNISKDSMEEPPEPEPTPELNVSIEISIESTDGEVDTKVLKSRKFVYDELVATEKDYVEDLKTVLHSYYDAMDPEHNTSIPLRLRDKRHVVFGNLPDIHTFHETKFSKALEQYQDHPENVGECFLKFMEEFQLYSEYCKSRSQSEALMNECTESSAFFKGLQLNLDHKLPLDSYLIKPVQRITKYQLLLKDMMKHCSKAKDAHSELKKALDAMLRVLRNLNDSLHVVGIKGFPGSLAEQGRLLVHDPMQMWVKSSTSRSLFSRTHERHCFLFEKMIIFSKKAEVPSQKKDRKPDNYRYKGHLTMAEIGLRSNNGQPLQFELTLHGQQKVFIFQAATKEVYDMWTSEVKRLLKAQLLLMKDIVIKSGTLNRKTYKGRAKLSTLTRDSRFFAESMESQSLTAVQIKRRKSILSSNAESSVAVGQSLSPHLLRRPREFDEESFLEDYDELGSGIVTDNYETLAPSAPRHYLAMCDYNPGDSDENGISLTADQEVEVIGINQYGWWWVRATNATSGEVEEGWVPASYLKVLIGKITTT